MKYREWILICCKRYTGHYTAQVRSLKVGKDRSEVEYSTKAKILVDTFVQSGVSLA